MLRIDEIRRFYPGELHRFPDFLLREYLQYKILGIIYESASARKLHFIGGGCLRIMHNNQRFSEDLDFDLHGLSQEEFDQLGTLIQKELSLEGYEVEIRLVHKNAWHCYIRFPGLLFDLGLSGYREQKILIQLDGENQDVYYYPDRVLLNKFEVFTEVMACPLPVIFAQKCLAILTRIRNKGRDFYDLSMLMGMQVSPDMDYLKNKLNIGTIDELKRALIAHCETLSMQEQAADVEPFLFKPQDARRVSLFVETIRGWKGQA